MARSTGKVIGISFLVILLLVVVGFLYNLYASLGGGSSLGELAEEVARLTAENEGLQSENDLLRDSALGVDYSLFALAVVLIALLVLFSFQNKRSDKGGNLPREELVRRLVHHVYHVEKSAPANPEFAFRIKGFVPGLADNSWVRNSFTDWPLGDLGGRFLMIGIFWLREPVGLHNPVSDYCLYVGILSDGSSLFRGTSWDELEKKADRIRKNLVGEGSDKEIKDALFSNLLDATARKDFGEVVVR